MDDILVNKMLASNTNHDGNIYALQTQMKGRERLLFRAKQGQISNLPKLMKRFWNGGSADENEITSCEVLIISICRQ